MKSTDAPTDGRLLRSERSRRAIVDAMEALVAEPGAEPTVDAVAARAGVSVRTLFRQLHDTDALFAALYERFGAVAIRIAEDWQPVGSLEEDLAALIAARVRMFVYVSPLRRFAQSARLVGPSARTTFAPARRKARGQIREIFLAHSIVLADDDLEMLDAWISLEVWDRLREQQGCSHARALRVLHATARTLTQAVATRAR